MRNRLARVSDGIVVGANMLSILVLLLLILGDFIRFEGVYMTWIQIEGHGETWTTYFGIEALARTLSRA